MSLFDTGWPDAEAAPADDFLEGDGDDLLAIEDGDPNAVEHDGAEDDLFGDSRDVWPN